MMRFVVFVACMAGCSSAVQQDEYLTPPKPDAAQTCISGFPLTVSCPATAPAHGAVCTVTVGICGYTEDGCGFVFASCPAGTWQVHKSCGEAGTPPPGA